MRDLWTEPLTLILRSLRITSPLEFVLGGRTFRATGGAAALASAPGAGGRSSAPIVSQLADALYAHCYCRPFSGTIAPDEPPREPLMDHALIAALSKANATQERWESGWRITQAGPLGRVTAERRGQRRDLWGGEYISEDGPGAMPRAGTVVRIYRARESLSLQPGLYHAFGATPADFSSLVGMVRVYWNLRTAGPAVVAQVTTRLNFFSVPFRFKCVVTVADRDRTDAGVLYVPKEYFRTAAAVVRETHDRVAPELGAEVPLFTSPLGRGLAVAEDPTNGESFGQHRCRMTAEALWDAHEAGDTSAPLFLERLAARFGEEGVEPERWHLNQGSSDVEYDRPVEVGRV